MGVRQQICGSVRTTVIEASSIRDAISSQGLRKRKEKKRKEKKRPDQVFQEAYINHSVREAFKLATLDGSISASEVKELRKLY